MPTYAWRCLVCDSSNSSTDERCISCAFPASAPGQAILEARAAAIAERARRQVAEATAGQGPEPDALNSEVSAITTPTDVQPPTSGLSLLILFSGIVCLIGGVSSIAAGHWPGYLPPFLDLIAVPLSLLSETLGAVVGGLLAITLGVLFIGLLVLAHWPKE